MAADRITVGLDLTTTQAQREVAKLQKKIDALSKSMGGAMRGMGGGGGGDKVRALGTGLSKATVRADEFTKSLEASNARVIAFGASAGLIMQVDRALKAMVSSAIKVEKAMADVNVVMNASTKTLDKFGRGMFKVAKETAQGFDTVAEAATELARQGLGMEQTLLRTKDALILTRLTGMNAADSVKSLTAAVNSFNKEGVTSAQVINKMAKVDAAFAVSSEDLAKSISRVGSSAVDAGVSLDQLMAITTAVQQKTARGGAVIGNAFKTIFTRIQRSDVQKKLKDIGVALTQDGKLLDGVTILENLSRKFDKLTKAQQASVGESVAGVFQINILKAAMSDLVNVNSEYARSLRISNTATDEAYQRNLELNKTLDSLVNRTMANLTSAGASLGGGAFEPAIRKILGGVNAAIESFGKGGMMEGVGETVGKGLLTGIGNFISGPGIIMVGAAITKLGLNLAKFAGTALKDFMGLNTAAKQRASLEEMTLNKLREQPSLITKIATGETTIATIQKDILATMKLQTLERAQQATIAKTLATGMYAGGARVTPAGSPTFIGPMRPGKAGGFIPNFNAIEGYGASARGERAAAAAGGYKAGSIKTMSQPGAGTMMYNSAETVKQFPGMSQKAIMPPASSSAGAGYKAAFGAAHGFNPYAASGFVPNFAAMGLRNVGYGNNPAMFKNQKGASQSLTEKGMSGAIKRGGMLNVMGGGIAMLVPRGSDARAMSKPVKGEAPYGNFKASFPILSYKPSLMRRTKGPIDVRDEMELAAAKVTKTFAMSINPPARRLHDPEIIRALETTRGSKGAMSAAAGAAFEVGMDLALDKKAASKKAQFGDFDVRPPYSRRAREKAFGGSFSLGDFKVSSGYSARSSMTAKIAKEAITNGPGRRFIKHTPLTAKAMGFVPNFSPLTSAVGREMSAGVPASAIRVGSSPALRSAGNPGGVGVFNTIDEPAGLNQGINRSRAMGINPKSHGAASGFIPNYVPAGGGMLHPMLRKSDMKPIATAVGDGLAKPAKKLAVSADKIMMASMVLNMAASGLASGSGAGPKLQSGINAGANVLSMAGMGFAVSGGNPLGALAGAGLGALTSMGDIKTALGGDDAKIAAEEFAEASKIVTETITKITGAMKQLADFESISPEERIKAVNDIINEYETLSEKAQSSKSEPVKKIFKQIEGQIDVNKLRKGGGKGMSSPDFKEIEKFLSIKTAELTAALAVESVGGLDNLSTKMSRFAQLPFGLAFTGPGSGGTFSSLGSRGIDAEMSGDPEFVRRQATATNFATMQAGDYFRSRIGGLDLSQQRALLEAPMFQSSTTQDEQGNTVASIRRGTGADSISNNRKILEENIKALQRPTSEGFEKSKVAGGKIRKGAREMALLFKKTGLEALATELEHEAKKGEGKSGVDLRKANVGLAQMMMGLFSVGLKGSPFTPSGPGIFAGGGASLIESQLGGAGGGSRLSQGEVDRNFRLARKSSLNQSLDSQFGASAGLGRLQRGSRRRSLNRANEGRMAGITMAGDSLIDEQSRLARLAASDKEKTTKAEINIKQKEKLQQEEIKALETLVADVKATGMTLKDQNDFIKKYNEDYANLSDKDIELKLKALEGSLVKDEILSKKQDAEIKFLEATQRSRIKNQKETKHLQDENKKNRKDENDNITETNKVRKEERKALLEFQATVRTLAIKDAAEKARNEALGLRGLKNKGLGITETEIAGANRNARRAAIKAGTSKGNPGQAFSEAFAYGDTNAILEFEDGVVSVANSMKDSFSSAFQSIASGADTVGGAIANMANGILNSISQVSTNMFTNMLFSGLGPEKAQGGYIPGYNAGGLVTGGSGNKDDVLTRMRGGEFVIKKSAVNKVGLPALNAINGYANGGPTMGQMGLIAAGSTAAAGIIGSAMQPGSPSPAPSQNYGYGRGAHGYFGGPDPDARGGDVFSGGGGRAGVSLNKAFVYYRRDPQTGQLVSERARPTEGRFEVSRSLSLLGRLGADDPQTARMFEKEQTMGKYQGYLASETQRRSDAVDAVKKQKRGRLISAYMNAAMLIGGAKFMDSRATGAPRDYGNVSGNPPEGFTPPDMGGYGADGYPIDPFVSANAAGNKAFNAAAVQSEQRILDIGSQYRQDVLDFGKRFPPRSTFGAGNANGGLARVMGGEYVMSPEAVRTHGVGFMTELNRGNVPGYASGGLVGGGAGGGMVAGGAMTNNVNINVNIDKNGKATAESDATSGKSGSFRTRSTRRG
jgi:TP901 family phage tail tape measure protein